jgi:hypothetical protein
LSSVVAPLGVLLAADPEQSLVDQPDHAGRDPVEVEVAAPQVGRGGRAQAGQGAGEAQHVRELLRVALLAPQLVVAVLGAAAAVHAGGLDVPERVRRDPDAGPGGRDGQRPDPQQRGRLGDRRPGRVEVGRPAGAPLPGDARAARVAADQALDGGGQRRCVVTHSEPG